jgi:acetolactate synthase I/II/III large subunit
MIRVVAPDSFLLERGDEPPSPPPPLQTSPHLSPFAEAARHIVEALVEAGCGTFFGIPGGPVVPMFDAILQTPGARLIQSRHETAAAFEAAGYHRATGRVPVVVVTAGPGATNALTGVASAHFEGVPMIVLCGDVAWAAEGKVLLQNGGPDGLDVEHLFSKITRATVRVTCARSAATQALAALDAAIDPARPGPALLVVPIQCASERTAAARTERAVASRRAEPPRRVVAEVCAMLAQARRPLLVVGGACRPHASALRRMLDMFHVPFVTTPRAKGLVSEAHPRSLRHGGLAASYWARRYTAEGVDVALVLGTDLDDCSVGPTPYIAAGGRLVHVDTDSTVFHRNLVTHIAVTADVGAFIDAISRVVVEDGYRVAHGTDLVRDVRAATSPFENPGFEADDTPALRPDRAIADLVRAAGPGARFVTDIGEHMLFALHYLIADGPDAFAIQLGLGSMGSGICSAIGLALGDPSRRVVCICGDGGMQMTGMEALVASRERLPVVFAVFNDARYNMVHHGFRTLFGREADWDTPWVDFTLWARSLGIEGLRIDHPGELTAQSLDRLAAGGGPIVLDMRIDPEVRLKGAGRVESLQQMSTMASGSGDRENRRDASRRSPR